MIRVLLADDQDLVRAGLRLIIDRAPGLEVVGEAANGTDAVRLARETRADVVLMDIRMPGLDGLSATRRIMAEDDLAGVKVLILTTFEVDQYVFEALRSGASGFLGKGARPEVLIEAIRTVARGDALLSPAANRPRARGGRADRPGNVQHRDRRPALAQPADGQDARQPCHGQGGRQGPSPARRARLPGRPGQGGPTLADGTAPRSSHIVR